MCEHYKTENAIYILQFLIVKNCLESRNKKYIFFTMTDLISII